MHTVRKRYIHLNCKEKGVIIGMKENNASYREIGEVIGRNHGSIQRFYHKYEQIGNINWKIQ